LAWNETRSARLERTEDTIDIYSGTGAVLSWAYKLSSEERDRLWNSAYIEPDGFRRVLKRLEVAKGGVIALTGVQGAGKTEGLRRLFAIFSMLAWLRGNRTAPDVVLVRWQTSANQIQSLLNGDAEVFIPSPLHPDEPAKWFQAEYRARLQRELRKPRMLPLRLPEGREIPARPEDLDVRWAEGQVGSSTCEKIKEEVWLDVFAKKSLILIDLPDYSRSDRRLITRHLSEIYRLWDRLSRYSAPAIVIAIQKDLINRHFFFDKMEKIEISPLTSEELLRSYVGEFDGTYPFTEAALLKLAVLSRGIPRRFKRYAALVTEAWCEQGAQHEPINPEFVSKAVTEDRLIEDLEVEFEELFPRSPEHQRQAGRLLLRLSERGPTDQTNLAKDLHIKQYEMSRILAKLEGRYTRREGGAEGHRKIVHLLEL